MDEIKMETNNGDFVEDIKPKCFEKSLSNCSVDQNESQIDDIYSFNEECKDIEIETAAANDYLNVEQIRAEEGETSYTQTNETHIVEHMNPRTDENTHNVRKTHGVHSKVEMDILGDWNFVTPPVVIVEDDDDNNVRIALRTNFSIVLDKIQSFDCDVCHDSFTSKERILQHIQSFHKINNTIPKKVARNKRSAKKRCNVVIVKKKKTVNDVQE